MARMVGARAGGDGGGDGGGGGALHTFDPSKFYHNLMTCAGDGGGGSSGAGAGSGGGGGGGRGHEVVAGAYTRPLFGST
jgi:hypothetical protein